MNLFQSSKEETEPETQSTQSAEQTQPDADEQIAETKGSDLFLVASLGSIVLSMYEYYVRGNTERALFVGQWPQTILAMALYLRQRRDDN